MVNKRISYCQRDDIVACETGRRNDE